MKKRVVMLIIIAGIISWFSCFSYGEEVPNTGIGFQITPAGISGFSFKHWITPKRGFQFLFGGWKDKGDYGITLGGGILYKLRDKERTDAYLGAGIGGYRDVEKWEKNKKVWEGVGGEGIFGVEYFCKNWEGLALNLEVGIFAGRDRESWTWKDEEVYWVIGIGTGMGMHYYF